MFILADTGILLRAVDPADPQHAVIERAVRVLTGRGDVLAAALQNLAEFWNVCTRPATSRGGLGPDLAETESRVQDVESTFPILDDPPGLFRVWRRLVVAHGVKGKQVHDARLAALMEASGIAHILTLNGPDFARHPGLTALDPAAV